MRIEKVLDMIDEYLLEPNNIDKEWVEALCTVRKVYVENVQLKKEIEKFEKIEHFGTKTIEAQTKEIERLNSLLEIEKLYETLTTESFKTAKSEAIKDFAERLKTIMCNNVAYFHKSITITIIDNLVKEMTGTKLVDKQRREDYE